MYHLKSLLSRFAGLLSLLYILTSFAATLTWAQTPLFTFVQISDSQPKDLEPLHQVRFEEVLDTIVDAGNPWALIPLPVDFVLFAGDLVDRDNEAEWDRFVQTIDTRLTVNRIPYRAVPGNHDQSNGNFSLYEQYIASTAVWDVGSAQFPGHNDLHITPGWNGLRFIGVNNSNGDSNVISSADIADLEARLAVAVLNNENVFLMAHHDHNGGRGIIIQNILETPEVVGYMRGHNNSPHARQGLDGISNPNVWDFCTNAIFRDGALLYFEVFETEMHAYVIKLIDNPTQLPVPKIIPLVHVLTPTVATQPPVADFHGTPLSGTVPLIVRFTDVSTGVPTSWQWDFGDGSTSTAQHPDHIYNVAGTYEVTLTVTNTMDSSVLTRTGYIVVNPPQPSVADFSGTPTTGSAALTVAFTDLSSGPPTSWAWDFGDGGTSTLQHPTHVYTTPGPYAVTLTVSNTVGGDGVTKVDYITVDVPPPITTFVAVADAQVNSSSPTRNYGTATTLRVRDEGSSATYNSYVQFVVSGLGGAAVRTATLRLYVTDGSDDGGTLYAVDSGWTETTLTYATAPVLTGVALGSVGGVTTGQWVTFDVTAVVTGEGVYSFGLTNDSSNSVYYSSRQGSQPPELVVETLP